MLVTLIAAISADGKIAERPDQTSTDWTSKEDLDFFVSKTKEIGTLVMGRKTFDTIGKPLKGRRVIVMTREVSGDRGQPARLNDFSRSGGVTGVEYTTETPRELLVRLEAEGVTKLALCGGAQIYGAFLKEGLVDELFLTVEPVLFGGGVPLAVGFDRMNLDLVETSKMGEQGMLLHYRVRGA